MAFGLIVIRMETESIRLRRWQESDAATLYKYASDPELGPLAGWPAHKSVEESLEIIRTVFSNDDTWAIELKSTGEAIGCIGFYTCGKSNIEIGQNDVEAGYWIARPYWNQGICTQALGLLQRECFLTRGYDTMWADHFVGNPASGRVMQKCGLKDTGRTNMCSQLLGGDKELVRIYRLDREDYLAMCNR